MQNENKPDKTVSIVVNTVSKPWNDKHISYNDVIVLAFGSYSDDPKIIYTVDYFKGDKDKEEGSLTKGDSVKVKDGMIFNVTQTDQS
jgi:hypothetical protein